MVGGVCGAVLCCVRNMEREYRSRSSQVTVISGRLHKKCFDSDSNSLVVSFGNMELAFPGQLVCYVNRQ
jgi:hypothetical protein